jgi:hypothetical protein
MTKTNTATTYTEVQRKARYGRHDWIAWYDKAGRFHGERKSIESVKRCLLDTGTQGQWLIVTSGKWGDMLGAWWIGINMISQMKRGIK